MDYHTLVEFDDIIVTVKDPKTVITAAITQTAMNKWRELAVIISDPNFGGAWTLDNFKYQDHLFTIEHGPQFTDVEIAPIVLSIIESMECIFDIDG